MKKFLSIILASAMLLTLAACGSDSNSSTAETTTAAETTKADNTDASSEGSAKSNEDITIVMVAKHEGIAWFDDMRVGVEQFAKDTGVNAYQIAPEGGDAAKQVQMVEDLIAQGVDAILVVPNDAQSMKPVLKKAREQGIVVVSHEASDITDVVDYDLEAFKNEEHGVRFAEELATAMGGEGQYCSFVGALTMTTHMQWFDSMVEHLKANYPNMELINEEPYEDMNDTKAAYDKAIEVLKAYPDIKGFTDCAASGAGIAQALEEKNKTEVSLVSTATPSQGGVYIKGGWMDAGLAWQPADAGYVAAEIALKLIKGETVDASMTFKKSGYETVVFDNNVIYGNAPLVFKPDNVDNFTF